MTTCAWDGKTLAADTRCTAGGFPYAGTKAYRLKDGRLYAASGSAEECESVRIWLESGGDRPKVENFCGIVIGADCSIWRYEDKLVPFQVETAFHAIGSGRDYAMAALHMGKSAREAVELAMIYDIYTGGPITEIALESRLGS